MATHTQHTQPSAEACPGTCARKPQYMCACAVCVCSVRVRACVCVYVCVCLNPCSRVYNVLLPTRAAAARANDVGHGAVHSLERVTCRPPFCAKILSPTIPVATLVRSGLASAH